MPTPSVSEPPYQIKVRNPAFLPTGEVDACSSLKVIPRFLGVGSFNIDIPYRHPKAALLTRGCWVQFLSSDNEIMSGQVRGLKLIEDENNVGGTISAYGPSSEQVIADRLAFQVPGSPASTQGADDYDNRSGVAETVIKQYVNLNAGPGAIAARRTTGLIIEADLLRGASIKGSARMDNLLELIAPLAISGGIGFRVMFVGNSLQFTVYTPTDKSGTAKFGIELGNLVSYEQTKESSKTNTAIVGGQGDGIARVFREINDTTAQTDWSCRSESFVDRRDSTDTVELDQAGTEEVTTNGPVLGISIKTADTPDLAFYRDYFLGDKVSIPLAGVTDILREVEIEWSTSKGPSTTSTTGTATSTGTLKMLKQLEILNKKVAALEAKK